MQSHVSLHNISCVNDCIYIFIIICVFLIICVLMCLLCIKGCTYLCIGIYSFSFFLTPYQIEWMHIRVICMGKDVNAYGNNSLHTIMI